jgi:hypothetical protein
LGPYPAPDPMAIQSEEHVFAHRGWTIVVRLTVVRAGECVAGHADLHENGAHRCRLVSASVMSDPVETIVQLDARSRLYIDEWIARHP